MLKSSWIAGLAAVAAVGTGGAALAHHSFAMFDVTKNLALTGVVYDFQWTNPHSWIELDVPGAGGAVEKWSIELNSPNNLTRQGWNRHMVNPGDKLTIVVNPMRDGSKAGLFYALTLPDGREVRDPRVPAGPLKISATE